MVHELNGRQVHSVSFGSGPGTLVAIAGSFASWEIWEPVFERLSTSWRVVGFDHDGVGATRVAPEDVTFDRWLETLFSVLDAQRVERCVLAGDSNNAALAVEAVARRPERFAGLVIASGSLHGFDRPEARAFVAGLRAGFDPTLDRFVDLVFPEPATGHLKQWLKEIIRRTDPEACARIVELFYGMDLRPRLADIKVPVMLFHGEADLVSPAAAADAKLVEETVPGSEVHLLPGVGHLPLLSAPARVATLLDAFLARTTPRPLRAL